jgi:hypothetical protein
MFYDFKIKQFCLLLNRTVFGGAYKETAECLSSWIRQVIQAAETWISLDIQKGIRWNDQIKNELEQSKVGIICLNKDNLQSEWVLFEAGALSKTQDAHVCTFLLDISPADVKPPLGQFQHTLFVKEDIRKLVQTINDKIIAVGEKTIPEKDLNEVFDVFYPRLEEKLNAIQNEKSVDGQVKRTDREILEEILQTIRATNQVQIKQLYEMYHDMNMRSRMEYMELLAKLKEDYLNINESITKQNIGRLLKSFNDDIILKLDELK